jgi:ACT domain-containing protein
MTDRVYALTVVLEKDIQDDDVEQTIQAIKQIKGVLDVTSKIVDIQFYASQLRVRVDLESKLWKVLRDEPATIR